ncbi:hypothetical protein EVAR_24919_1 [Eumeta japonica]|uniref:Uncharacterized protein n=1 Tax=Eumeta variegata TaxID=151549 RepID=A0A4C1V8D3_EUMVA|nr:hypothetical protein EVAR_24919_1 [Eumeta japonica]
MPVGYCQEHSSRKRQVQILVRRWNRNQDPGRDRGHEFNRLMLKKNNDSVFGVRVFKFILSPKTYASASRPKSKLILNRITCQLLSLSRSCFRFPSGFFDAPALNVIKHGGVRYEGRPANVEMVQRNRAN